MRPTRIADQRTEVRKTLNYFTTAYLLILFLDDYHALYLRS
ncbi:unnamed protein product [Callosobruchus maculatus]|uniref:Uncharacterized protein n=1 Tax=Callosobruchus maculatus TaxID=64391 RepID=A0A653CM57_CALMS|nr:unnamed protein product [Callosobruchus maculatus]